MDRFVGHFMISMFHVNFFDESFLKIRLISAEIRIFESPILAAAYDPGGTENPVGVSYR